MLSLFSCDGNLSKKEKQVYLEQGTEVIQSSFMELSSQLKAQMENGGPENAIPFCNVNALPITNELSNKFNVVIKRTSDQLRNPQNKASEREIEVIATFKNLVEHSKKMKPIVEVGNDEKVHFYAPIMVSSNCLVCHGELKKSTKNIIGSYYPNDKAFDYKIGEVRGIWSITFKN